jgi:hypothetical protein
LLLRYNGNVLDHESFLFCFFYIQFLICADYRPVQQEKKLLFMTDMKVFAARFKLLSQHFLVGFSETMKTASGITGPNCDINTKQECYHDTATLGQ